MAYTTCLLSAYVQTLALRLHNSELYLSLPLYAEQEQHCQTPNTWYLAYVPGLLSGSGLC